MNALAANTLGSLVQHSVLRVFVVDDSAVIRERLLKMLNAMPAVTVLGYATTAADAIEDILSAPPDVVILDLSSPPVAESRFCAPLDNACRM